MGFFLLAKVRLANAIVISRCVIFSAFYKNNVDPPTSSLLLLFLVHNTLPFLLYEYRICLEC